MEARQTQEIPPQDLAHERLRALETRIQLLEQGSSTTTATNQPTVQPQQQPTEEVSSLIQNCWLSLSHFDEQLAALKEQSVTKQQLTDSFTAWRESWEPTWKKMNAFVENLKPVADLSSLQAIVESAGKTDEGTETIEVPEEEEQDYFVPIPKFEDLKRCFYTALFALPGQQYDKLTPFSPIPGWEYVLFTNLNLPPTPPWTICKVPMKEETPVLQAKRVKWLSHLYLPSFDIAVWCDA